MVREVVQVPEFAAWHKSSDIPVSFVVRSNGFIFTAGIPPLDTVTGGLVPGDIEAQTVRVMENIGLCLSAAGSSFEKVVRTTVFVTNAAHFATINAVYSRYFDGLPPARTFVVVGSWPAPIDIEIEVIAEE